jgi:predicted dehydrogenase
MNNDKSPNTDRRNFLKTSSAAGVGVGVWTAAAAAKETKSANERVNIAVVGCGGRGSGASNDNLSINNNVRLVALADMSVAKCQGLARRLKGRHKDKVSISESKMFGGLDAYKKVLDEKSVDAVLFATPPGFRPYHVADAVKAGKHVFAEKPSCVDPAGYRVCIAAHDEAVKNKTAIVTGTQYRRQVNYIGAVEQIRKGTIGEVISAITRYCSSGIWYRGRKAGVSDAQYQISNWMHFIWASGDQIAEQAVHNIDTLNWVMGGPPESVYGSGGRFTRPSDSEMWDSISLDYTYPGNRVLSFMCRQIPGTRSSNTNLIYGTKGVCHIGAGSSGSKITDHKGKQIWSMKGSIGAAYRQEHKDFIDSITSGKPIVELRQTADSSLTAVMGRMAAYTGQEVTWDFVTKKSKLDLFPKDLKIDSKIASPGHAVPGKTKLT